MGRPCRHARLRCRDPEGMARGLSAAPLLRDRAADVRLVRIRRSRGNVTSLSGGDGDLFATIRPAGGTPCAPTRGGDPGSPRRGCVLHVCGGCLQHHRQLRGAGARHLPHLRVDRGLRWIRSSRERDRDRQASHPADRRGGTADRAARGALRRRRQLPGGGASVPDGAGGSRLELLDQQPGPARHQREHGRGRRLQERVRHGEPDPAALFKSCGYVGGRRNIRNVRARNVTCASAKTLARRWANRRRAPRQLGSYRCFAQSGNVTCIAGTRQVRFRFGRR